MAATPISPPALPRLSIAFTISGGNYAVDWGDGSAVENIGDGVQAERNLSFNDLGAETLTADGYRQAIVTITPQSGQTLTSAELTKRHSDVVSGQIVSGPALDVIAAGATFASIVFYDADASASLLQKFQLIGTCNISNAKHMFYNCRSLQCIPLFDMSGVTDATNMFYNCYSLQSIPLLDTSSVTNATPCLMRPA